jgi:hypothetical protein
MHVWTNWREVESIHYPRYQNMVATCELIISSREHMGKAFVHTYIIHAGRRDIKQICLPMTLPGEGE